MKTLPRAAIGLNASLNINSALECRKYNSISKTPMKMVEKLWD